jgi:glycosyltransferase involved in cell wall biosynthesis
MKILQLISSTGFFGAEKMVLELAAALRRQGNGVVVANLFTSGRSSRRITEKAFSAGIPVREIACAGRLDLSVVRRLKNEIAAAGIDLVHSHGYKGNFYAFLAARAAHAGLAATCHNWLGDSLKMGSYRWLDKMVLKRFDRVAVVSQQLKNEVECCGIAEGKVSVIPNGIAACREDRALRETLRGTLGLGANEIVIGTVGRLSPEKGHRFLLEAASRLVRSGVKVKFLLVGDGPLREALAEKARELGIACRVVFTGVRDDAADLVSLMDVFVLPSLREGMPMALLEAMARGIPSVATAVGEVPAMLDDGRNGALVPAADAARMAKAILLLIRDRAAASALSIRAAEKVKAEYSSEIMAEKYLALYRSIT